MKRVPCPKCQNYNAFDETHYEPGQSLVFICEHCKKQFSIRIGATPLRARRREEKWSEGEHVRELGCLVVIENVFGYKQILPLRMGDNLIGRKSPGTEISTPIETADRSMDRKHCYLHVSRDKKGTLSYTLRDFPSITGTFLRNELLGDKERRVVQDGDVITIGATSLLLRTARKDTEE